MSQAPVHRQNGVAAQWDALRWLHTFSSLPRVQKCRRLPNLQPDVEVRLREAELRAHYVGLQTCGSVHACPMCGPRIMAGRADELLYAIEHHDGDVIHVSLTARHHAGQSLKVLWDATTEAWTAVRKDREVEQLLGDDPLWAKRVEVTHGENGWHPHVHALLFVERGTDADAIGHAMFEPWQTRLVSAGLDPPLRDSGGLFAKTLDLTEGAAAVADYVAKGTFPGAPLDQPSSAMRAALELASTQKLARRGNRTPFQLLVDAVTLGLFEDLELWRTYEKESKGRRVSTWSSGARLRLLVGMLEASDAELAASTDHGGAAVCLVEKQAWPFIVATRDVPAAILRAVEDAGQVEAGYHAAVATVARLGFPGAVRRPRRLAE